MEDTFDQIDSDGDGLLSMDEAVSIYPNLSRDDFAFLDLNGDGSLTLAELQGNADENCKCGCANLCCRAAETPAKAVKGMLGDWLLLGLTLIAMAAWSTMTHSHKK